MLDTDSATQTDTEHRLTADLFRVAVFKLHQHVPPPATNDPELAARFVNAGIAEIGSMVPGNAEEISIAVRVIAADTQAADCIRHARGLSGDPAAAMKCHAQANHYFRTANAARSLLLRVQSARRKREAVPATCNSDAWTIHATQSLLSAAANGEPIEAPQPEPPPPPVADDHDDDDKFARYDLAEQYAALYPRRAAEIRANGGVPPTATWGRPDPDTVAAVLASTSPMLQQLDCEYGLIPAA